MKEAFSHHVVLNEKNRGELIIQGSIKIASVGPLGG